MKKKILFLLSSLVVTALFIGGCGSADTPEQASESTIESVSDSETETEENTNDLPPALKTVEVGETIDESGYKLTLDKVEFAENQTRLYVTFKNDGEEDFVLDVLATQLAQGTKQYETLDLEEDIGQFKTGAIMPGVEQSGIVFFDALNPDEDFTIEFDGWDLSEEDMVYVRPKFDVSVN